MSRHGVIAAGAVLSLLLASGAQAQERGSLVTVVEPRVVVPVVQRAKVDVVVPLRLPRGVRPNTVFVELRDVVPDPGRPEIVPGGVTMVVPPSRTRPRRLTRAARLRVRFDTALVRPGSYVLRFDAWRQGRRARSTSFAATVGLPAPVLRPTEPLHVERILGPGDDKVQPLTVREMTSRSKVTITKLTQASEESEAGVVAGELGFADSVDTVIKPGGVLRVAPAATSGFPVGVSNGTLEVSAAELDTPIAVPFVVDTRFSRFWLACALFLGLVAGGLARYYLQRRIEQGQAQLALDSFRARVESERNLHPDGPFLRRTDEILRKIGDALEDDSLDGAGVQTLTANLQEELNKALAELDDRRTKTKPEIERRAAALAAPRSIPGVIRRELATVSQLIALAGQRLSVDAVDEATRQIEEANARFESGVLGTTKRWRDDVKKLTGAVLEATTLVGDAHEAATQAAELADAAADEKADDWYAALDAIAAAHAAANTLRDRVGRAAQAYRDRSETAAARTSDLERALSDLIATLEAASGSLLGAYERAANALRVADAQAAGQVQPAVAPWQSGIASAAYDTAGSSWSAPMWFAAERGRAVERRGWRRGVSKSVRRARRVQFVIIAFVVFVIGYELFEADFAGTVEQLVLAFLWAFTADLSLNGTLALAQQGGNPTQPPAPAQ